MKYRALIAVIIIFVFVVVGGIITSTRIGSKANLPSLNALIQTQPLMPDMDLPVLGTLPKIEGIAAWINTGGINQDDLKNKVVLVDFMTYSCINCIRTFPTLNRWYDKYHRSGLVMIGIHTPEFDFEKKQDSVQRAVNDYGIKFPVGLDNDYKTWNNFQNRFWPATYLFDRTGALRYTHFGEGNYEVTEAAIQELLDTDEEITNSSSPDFKKIASPETYFGWKRADRYAGNIDIDANDRALYEFPTYLPKNNWALQGGWTVFKEYALADGPSRLQFRFDAPKVYFVLAPETAKQTKVNVRLDGQWVPKQYAGADVSVESTTDRSYVTIEYPQLYELLANIEGEHTIELEFLEPNSKVYSITFGAGEKPTTSEQPAAPTEVKPQ
ncbi:redoxin domain-containing protein [Candidatus Uhrbacteria bacterium]|nr:redoxin domain-containing protein [Candidatus Uhrbacteria bacterium]